MDKGCYVRLQREHRSLIREPVDNVTALPSPTNLLEWHFVIEGAKNTDFEGGYYHGKVLFTTEYPFRPPSIILLTPNGRFSTNLKICMSMTDYHPETWNPVWSVGTILTGLLSFLHDTQPTTGSITSCSKRKQEFAKASLEYNIRNPVFRKMFPDFEEIFDQKKTQELLQQGNDLETVKKMIQEIKFGCESNKVAELNDKHFRTAALSFFAAAVVFVGIIAAPLMKSY
eukprot:g1647.t1